MLLPAALFQLLHSVTDFAPFPAVSHLPAVLFLLIPVLSDWHLRPPLPGQVPSFPEFLASCPAYVRTTFQPHFLQSVLFPLPARLLHVPSVHMSPALPAVFQFPDSSHPVFPG